MNQVTILFPKNNQEKSVKKQKVGLSKAGEAVVFTEIAKAIKLTFREAFVESNLWKSKQSVVNHYS
jgi:hypothetical protein